MINKSPSFNLKAVLMETGLAADTLRAWERRYGLPTPNRSMGGHRLYSQYDIETIKWLMARQAEGLSISLAVDLWNKRLASGLDPLTGNDSNISSSLIGDPALHGSDRTMDRIRTEWITACLNFNETNAEQAIHQAFSMYPVETVCMEVIQKGMSKIGELWYSNRASIQQEHFASGLAMRRLDALWSASPAPTRKHTLLVGCPSGEWHTFTPLMLSLFLRRRGFNVIYLGANVPHERFEETISKVRADLVILVAQSLLTAATLQTAAFALSGMNYPVAFGGRIFVERNTLIDRIPGVYLGDTIDGSLAQMEKILKNRIQNKKPKSNSMEYTAALQAFTARRLHIETTAWELMEPLPIDPGHLGVGISHLGDAITAALQLGDMEHVSNELEWLKVVLESHKRPPNELALFLAKYSLAIDRHIQGTGSPIKDWLRPLPQNP